MRPRRPRRSSEEVKALLLAAARDLFAEHGFGGTTTREIADRAGVDETILFRNYGTKERLFQEAVARPIESFLHDYTRRWLTAPPTEASPDEMLRTFVESLYAVAQQNRKLLLAAVPNHLGQRAQTALDQLERMAAEVAAAHNYRYDPHIAVRAAVALVITVSIFDTPLFGSHPKATRDQITTELTALLTHGLTGDRTAQPSHGTGRVRKSATRRAPSRG